MRRIILAAFFICTIIFHQQHVSATTWYPILDDTFVRSDTSTGTAGSTTGAGNNWTDTAGGVWNISSNRLQGFSNTSSDYLTKFLLRPASENVQDEREVVTIPANENFNQFLGLAVRYQSGTNNYYLAHISATGIYLYKVIGGTTTLISSNLLSIANTHSYSVDFSAAGISPTTLTVTVNDITASTLVGTVTGTDSAASLQTTGNMGLTTWYNSGTTTIHATRVQTFSGSQVSNLALAGTSSFAGSSGVAMPITDLQITGDYPTTTPVKLLVTNGTLAMSATTGLTFTGGQTGSVLYFSGTLANINAALATLTYTRAGTGTDTLEVSLVNSGEVFFTGNNHLYEYISNTLTWGNAKTAAEGLSKYGATGYLATITSQSENDFVSARLADAGWMGASDAAVEGVWKWVTGPENGNTFWNGAANGGVASGQYANWNTDEPNDSGGNEDCGQFLSGSSGKWNDLPCTVTTLPGYVVEYGAPGNMPTVTAKNIAITTSNLPTVNSFTPADNATNINPSANLSITFSQPVTVGTGNILIKKTSDNSTAESIDVAGARVTGSGTSIINIDPVANLADLAGYYIQIPNTAFKNGSNVFYAGIADTTTWNFTTSDTTPPTTPGTPSATTPTNNPSPTWSWSASADTGSGLERYLLKWSQTANCSGGFTTTTGLTAYTIPFTLSEGTWYFCVAARDNAQNDTVYIASGPLVIDTTAPVLTQVAQVPNTTASDTATYSFSTTESGTYTLGACGAQSQGIVSGDSTVTLSNLQPGTTYSCTLYVTDSAGNVSNALNIGPLNVVRRSGIPYPIIQAINAANASAATQATMTSGASQSPDASFTFKIDMKKGSSISDVKKLQEFLQTLGFFPKDIAPNGYFGVSTYKAVVAFQEKYTEAVLIPINSKKGTGLVGTWTRKKLNSLLK